MLGFGLTLLGGCVATSATGQADELLFPSHSIVVSNSLAALYFSAPNSGSTLNMDAQEHHGLYIAENLKKTGGRESTPAWGFRGSLSVYSTYTNTLMLSFCAKNGTANGAYRTHIDYTRPSRAGSLMVDQPSLYVSGDGHDSPRFVLQLSGGVFSITDSFSGGETTMIIPMEEGGINSGQGAPHIVIFSSLSQMSCDFVASSYRNEGLGVHQLTLPLRSLPAAFADSSMAVYEFQSQTLIEL